MSQLSVSPPRTNYHHMSSPASTISDDDDSNHSVPNDLRTSQKSRHHGFGGYASFYSPPQSHNTGTGHSAHPQPQYVATNECRLIDYRGARIAAFLAANRQGEYLLCLPQAFELFLKHLVGGLHTVYTKLKRLDIVPIVCNVEQVRILRGLGAIQPGVNRCKLLSTHDFDVLFKDCTTARSWPGRPPKRSSGIPSPEPGNYGTPTPIAGNQQGSNNLLPLLGFSNSKKARYSDDCDFSSENLELKQLNSSNVNLSASNNSAATAAAMLAANGYSALPFLQHLSAAANSMPNSQQQQQLVAAAAALGLPALPNRFGTNSPPPGVHSQSHFPNSANSGGNSATTPENSDFNPTAAYLWLLSQQQQHLPNAAAAAAALNLTSRNAAANTFLNGNSTTNNNTTNNGSPNLSVNNSTTNAHTNSKEAVLDTEKANRISPPKEKTTKNHHSVLVTADEVHKVSNGTVPNGTSQVNSSLSSRKQVKNDDEEVDDTTDDEDEDDDVESNNSSNHSHNPVSSTGFNGINNTNGRSFLETMNSIRNSSIASPNRPNQAQSQPEHCLETLLRNIEGLLAIAAHNARQQQTQLQLQKAELRAELASQLEREREMRGHVEKQFHEEQKIRVIYQKRFKKERKLRRKLEHELHQNQHQSQQSSASMNLSSSIGVGKSSPHGQSNGNTTNPANTLTVLNSNNKSPVSSLPPTPPTHTASSDEAE